jgi:hypothetical protein
MWLAPLWEYFWSVLCVSDCHTCDVNARCNLDHAICKMSLCYLCKYSVILYYVNLSLVHLIVQFGIQVKNTFNFFITKMHTSDGQVIGSVTGKCIVLAFG